MVSKRPWWLAVAESVVDHLETKQVTSTPRKHSQGDPKSRPAPQNELPNSPKEPHVTTSPTQLSSSFGNKQDRESLSIPREMQDDDPSLQSSCPTCKGTGQVICRGCEGRGYNLVQSSRMGWNNTIQFYTTQQICAVCTSSKGRMRCPQCNGKGT